MTKVTMRMGLKMKPTRNPERSNPKSNHKISRRRRMFKKIKK